MFMQDGPRTPEAAFVASIILQAYRDLFIVLDADSARSFMTQADQDKALSFLTDHTGVLARHRNHLCSLIGWDGDVLAERIRTMLDGADFPFPNSVPSPATIARHNEAVERIRARWRDLKLPCRSRLAPCLSVGAAISG